MNAREQRFEAIGTHWVITFFGQSDEGNETHALTAVRERIAQFDSDYSRFRSDSWVSRVGRSPGVYPLPADAKPMLDLYRELYELTDGMVTPLIGDVLIAAGYDAEYSLTPKEVHPALKWDDALIYDYPLLTLTQKTILDFGALGKGYLVDIVARVLLTHGIETFIVNAGGDIYVRGEEENVVQVALEDPKNEQQAIGVARISSGSICGSAGNRRTWGSYTHLINPQTLESPRDISALWVVVSTTLLADALATALFFCKPETLLSHYAFDYLLLRPDYSIERSPSFPAELFLSS